MIGLICFRKWTCWVDIQSLTFQEWMFYEVSLKEILICFIFTYYCMIWRKETLLLCHLSKIEFTQRFKIHSYLFRSWTVIHSFRGQTQEHECGLRPISWVMHFKVWFLTYMSINFPLTDNLFFSSLSSSSSSY